MYLNNEFEQETRSRKIDFLWMELTNRCNLKCVHCYAGSGPEEGADDTMTFDDYAKLLKESSQLGCKAVQFIGGEPTLNKDLPRLVELSKSLGFEKIEVFTNLIALPKPLLQCFVDNGVEVATSFYSADPAIHDEITERKGSHKRTVDNILRVLESGLPLRVGIIEMEQNKDGTEATTAFLQSLGVTDIGGDRQRGFGRAGAKDAPEMSELCGQCAGGTLAVSPDGKISPCIMSKAWSTAKVGDAPLTDIVTSDELAKVRQDIGIATGTVNAWCYPERTYCAPSNSPSPCTPCLPNGYCAPKSCVPNP